MEPSRTTSENSTNHLNVESQEKTDATRNRARSVNQNYSQQEEEQKKKILEWLQEMSDTGCIEDVCLSVEQDKSIDGIEFVKRALIFGIEHSSFECELISQLLSAVYNIFQGREVQDGFQLLLYRLPDLLLDVPNAPKILAKFISRAQYDEILPPAFIKDANVDNETAKEVLALVYATTHSGDEKMRLEHIWGPGDLTSITELKNVVELLLLEYFDNPDAAAAASSVQELNTPSFGGQIVKQALRIALDKNTQRARNDVIALLSYWNKMNLMSNSFIKRGFVLMASQLDDLKLDVPNAGDMFKELVESCVSAKMLPADFASN